MAAKIGRNEPCPCGSGLKYKRCCALKEGSDVPIELEEGPLKLWILLGVGLLALLFVGALVSGLTR